MTWEGLGEALGFVLSILALLTFAALWWVVTV